MQPRGFRATPMPRSQPPFFPPRKRARAHVEWHDSGIVCDPPKALDSDPGVPFELIARKDEPDVEAAAPLGSVEGYQVGDVLAGKYKLLRILGEGGMSAVWAVQNLVLDAQFALKLIKNDGGDPHAAERMLREARSAARIEHPAIIRMLDFGVTDRGDPFLVMELLSGVSLRERLLKDGALTPVEAVRLLLPIADALSVAHSHGVVHRDLKPDNIVCVPAGIGCQPKIIDFGIAKRLDQESSRITQTGTVLGSPEYMSPEQARGLPDVDHKTDIWSFSVALYEMVTGTTPFFRAGALASVLHAIIEEPVTPIAEFGIDDPELWSIISRGLQKFPAGRWEDMRSLGEALARWLLRQGVEEDVCMQSVRMVWLGASTSLPPLAIDASGDAESARLAALAEDYDVPKKGALKTALAIAAATLTVALIGLAAFYTRGAARPLAPVAASRPPPASMEAPKSALIAPAPPAILPAPSAAVPNADEPKPAEEKPAARAARATPTPKARERFVESRPRRSEPNITASGTTDTTVLPEVKAPPEFEAKASDNPYAGDEKPSGKASDNPYVSDGTLKDPASVEGR
jgi:transcription initiation factor TFIIIB Brf1 subunit/transcription initiation factor TFIIB